MTPAEKPVLSSAELIHLVQVELRRVGCLKSSVDDEWTPTVRRSLELFNKYSGSELNTKVASLDALDAVKTKQARVCPLTCSHGYKPDNESYVKITCDTGSFLNDRNECEKKHEKPSAMREKPDGPERPKQKQVQSGGLRSRKLLGKSSATSKVVGQFDRAVEPGRPLKRG